MGTFSAGRQRSKDPDGARPSTAFETSRRVFFSLGYDPEGNFGLILRSTGTEMTVPPHCSPPPGNEAASSVIQGTLRCIRGILVQSAPITLCFQSCKPLTMLDVLTPNAPRYFRQRYCHFNHPGRSRRAVVRYAIQGKTSRRHGRQRPPARMRQTERLRRPPSRQCRRASGDV